MDRIAWIADLNRTMLRRHHRSGLSLELVYASEAGERVRELMRKERECCAFLRFTLRERGDSVHLLIEAPEEARGQVDGLLAPFLPEGSGPAMSDACECGSHRSTQEREETAPSHVESQVGSPGRARAGKAAALTGAAALACGICCVLPFALPAVVLTTFGAGISLLAGIYWWAIGLAAGMVTAGWTWIWIQSLRSKRATAPSTMHVMRLATLILFVAVGWSYVEPAIREVWRP